MGGLGYDQLLRLGRPGRWRAGLGVILLVVGVFVVAPLVLQIPYALWLAATGRPIIEGLEALVDLDNPSPASLAYLNIVLASAIPLTWLVLFWLHRMKPRWLASVRPRLRWRYLLVCLALAFVALMATLMVGVILPQDALGADMPLDPQPFTRTTLQFALVVLVLTPLQAAGEEYLFRGYLMQAFGGVFNSRVLAVVGSALLFAIAHGLGQSWPIFVDRFAFGLVAGVLVLRTGGLEAGIAMHVLNNFFAFGFALAFSDLGTALNPTGGSWWTLPTTLTQSLVYLGLAIVVANAMGLARTTAPAGGVLEGAPPRV